MTNEPGSPVDQRRARSFGSAAADYDAYRPGYPDGAVDLALGGARLDRVLDLGAGTGKLTASLVGRAGEVVAVEPDPQMLAVLRSTLPRVDARPGHAESIPLPDGSVDAVLAGQAMHWFDLDVAVPEIARVLRPGGVLAGLWNIGDRDVEWLRGFNEAVADGEALPPRPGESDFGPMPGEPWFGPGEIAEHGWGERHTTETLVAQIGTHSRLLTAAPGERDAAMSRARDYLAARPETASGEFDVPMRTLVWRALRR